MSRERELSVVLQPPVDFIGQSFGRGECAAHTNTLTVDTQTDALTRTQSTEVGVGRGTVIGSWRGHYEGGPLIKHLAGGEG